LGQFTAVSTGRRFRFEGIPAGRWQLHIFTFNSDVPFLADVETQPGRDVTDLRVVRTAPGRITGQVVAPGVSDLSGLPVEALDTRAIDHVRGRATTDALGAFRFDSLPPGPYRLRLRARGHDPFARGSPAETPRRADLFALEEAAVEVRSGAEAHVEVRAAPGARLIVRCDDERLRARPDVIKDAQDYYSTEFMTNLVLTWPDGHSETAFGLYRGRNDTPWVLAPGRYRLRVLRFGEPSQDVVVDRAGEIEVTVTFGPAGR
jgi:hypothetical protein